MVTSMIVPHCFVQNKSVSHGTKACRGRIDVGAITRHFTALPTKESMQRARISTMNKTRARKTTIGSLYAQLIKSDHLCLGVMRVRVDEEREHRT